MSTPAPDNVDIQQVNAPAPAPSDPERGGADTRSHTGSMKGRVRQAMTRYDDMVLATDRVPFWNNILSGFFSWLVLASFLTLPGSFSSLDEVQTPSGTLTNVLHAVRNLPLYVPFSPLAPPPLRQIKSELTFSLF